MDENTITFDEWFQNIFNNEINGFVDYHLRELADNGELDYNTVKDLMEFTWNQARIVN